MIPLPVDRLLDDIRRAVVESPVVLAHAFPGSGKTTRIPPSLISVFPGKVLVLEPRRIAARLAAERVAHEMGERVGEAIGYQVRYDDRSSGTTRLKFITEGLLLKYMVRNPELTGIDCVILDEFHERSIHTDVSFAMIRLLQDTVRPDLRLVIMSATADIEEIRKKVPGTRVFTLEGRLHPLRIDFLDSPDSPGRKPLSVEVAKAVRELYAETSGDILVFLPGMAEIRASMEALKPHAAERDAELLPMSSSIPFREQARVFEPSERRKIILSTNVAETSITIEGVTGVVDSGLARIAGFAHWSGLPTLDVRPVSQASCIQRAGRAGRVSPGVVKRLYSEMDFKRRPLNEKPEIIRCDLAQMLLDLRIVLQKTGSDDLPVDKLPWLERPPREMVEACSATLKVLGALDNSGRVTKLGCRLSSWPFHPRLARMVAEGEKLGCAPQSLLCAAIISEGMLFRAVQSPSVVADSDVGYQREVFVSLEKAGASSPGIESPVDPGKRMRIAQSVRATCQSIGCSYDETMAHLGDDMLAQAILAGFPDRVAQVRRRDGGSRDRILLNLCGGGGGVLSRSSVVRNSEFLVAIEADEETLGVSAADAVKVRVASAVSAELLVLAGGDFVREDTFYKWDEKAESVRVTGQVRYGRLVLEERHHRGDDARCEEILFAELRRLWPRPFSDDGELQSYAERCGLIRSCGAGAAEFPDLRGDSFELFLRHISSGKRSFAEIRKRELSQYVEDMLRPEARRALLAYAPQRIQIGCNRKAEVHYEEGKAPWLASRIQDFFGTLETPRICAGRVPLVVHLLAPNGRAVQITDDLAGFWERSYRDVRKELSRRYPRHYWPEDPRISEPRMPGRRKN